MKQEKYYYTFNDGKKIYRDELRELILSKFDNSKKSITEICEEINMQYVSVGNIVRHLSAEGLLIGKKQNRTTYFRKIGSCALANLLYDKDAILKNFKIKKKIKRTVDQSKNISYPNDSVIKYNNSYMDIMYL
jgi:predicted transcriptional regulator